jgi:predicted pyridoxine 5'-phosphate oxidase superfamily flavin-nucleotide-binding protein
LLSTAIISFIGTHYIGVIGRESIMGHKFSEIAFTPNVKTEQERSGSRRSYARLEEGDAHHDRLGAREAVFIAERDSFYMATISETGWPYIQHRGGPAGFVRILDDKTIGFADFAGNRQYVSVGNLQTDDRVSMFFMDYSNQTRLKLLGHVRLIEADASKLLAQLQMPDYGARIERGMVITMEGYDWNCPQHITPRFTQAQVLSMVAPLRDRIVELESTLADVSPRHEKTIP